MNCMRAGFAGVDLGWPFLFAGTRLIWHHIGGDGVAFICKDCYEDLKDYGWAE